MCLSTCREYLALERLVYSIFLIAFQSFIYGYDNQLLQSAYIPIQKAGSFIGVLNFNYLVSRLSVAFNKNKILSSGYCFLIDKNSSLISHPKLTTKCTTVLCAEGFSLSEYKEFQSKVLNNVVNPMATISSIVYRKGGKPWLLTLTNIEYETVQYTVIATVPQSEVEKTSTDTTSAIDNIVETMTIVFVFTMFVLVILLIFFSRKMIVLIVNPVNDLRAAFLLIRSDDLGHEMPTKASSRDLRLLLEAFIKVFYCFTCVNCVLILSYAYNHIHISS